jgi:hypothetical protein
VNYADHVEALRATRPDLAGEVAAFTGVKSVLEWMRARGLAGTTVDVVGQDEFESDFLIRLGPEAGWIAFGIT